MRFILVLSVFFASSFAIAEDDMMPKSKMDVRDSGHGALVVEKHGPSVKGESCSMGAEGGCGGSCCGHHADGEEGEEHGECEHHKHGGHHGWGRGTSFSIGLGYLDARWDRFSSVLSRGAPYFEFDFGRMFDEHFQGAIGLHMHESLGGSLDRENVYALDVRLEGRYFFLDSGVRPFAGLGLGFGGYRAWSVTTDTPTTLVQTKHGSGVIVGLIPEIGARFNLTERFGIDVVAKYNANIGAEAWKAGGWSAGVNLNFMR